MIVLFRPTVGTAEDESFSATLTDFTGMVSIIKAGDTEAFAVALHIPVAEGDTIITQAASSAEILIDDGSLISIAEKTEIKLNELTADNQKKMIQSSIFLKIGRLFANISRFTHRESRFSVKTPTAVAGVRGTDFIVETEDTLQTQVGVFDGEVTVEGLDETGSVMDDSRVLLTSGNQTRVRRFMRPVGAFAFGKQMLRHKHKMFLLRQKAKERRKEIRRLMQLRIKKHRERLHQLKKHRPKPPFIKKPRKPPIKKYKP